jgi:hypothetical protein
MQKRVGTRHSFVTKTNQHIAFGCAQLFVDAIPEQLSAYPARMQRIMNIDISLCEQVNAFHLFIRSN